MFRHRVEVKKAKKVGKRGLKSRGSGSGENINAKASVKTPIA